MSRFVPLFFLNFTRSDISLPLEGIGWRLPRTGDTMDGSWTTDATATASTVIGGVPTVLYDVTIRFYGIIEFTRYVGGSGSGAFYTGGVNDFADVGPWNVYRMVVSSPSQTYYTNAGGPGLPAIVDYQVTIPMTAGATVTLDAFSIDDKEASHTLSFPGVTDPAQPYLGQFLKMQVIRVALH